MIKIKSAGINEKNGERISKAWKRISKMKERNVNLRERITKLITEWGRFTQIIGNQLFNRENGLVNRMHGLIIRGK